MLFCDTVQDDAGAFDTLSVFCSQARGAGVPIAIHRRSLPETLDLGQRYDLASLVTDISPDNASGLVLIGGDKPSDSSLIRLRRLMGGHAIPTTYFGQFDSDQKRIAAAARLSYAIGVEPTLRDTQIIPGLRTGSIPLFASKAVNSVAAKPRLAFILPNVDAPETVSAIRALSTSRVFDVSVITTGQGKGQWADKLGAGVPLWHMSEVLPRSLAAQIDIAIFCSEPLQWYRFNALVANLVGNRAIMVDATPDRDWSALPDGIIPGTLDGAALLTWLQNDILPSTADIAAAMGASKLRKALNLPEDLAIAAATPSPLIAKSAPNLRHEGKLVFMPTNGVGLGHAKRCSLVAGALEDPRRAVFAAFPSCLQMLNNAGFDAAPLVSKSPHRPNHANDIVNHTRLSTLCEGAAGLVFDGGYVFESIMRATLDNELPSIWIRRGLWQESQNNSVALDRQKIFDRIVVPTEAFDELNHAAPPAENAVEVGPILQRFDLGPPDVSALRKGICSEIQLDGRQLVVTMLGGGVAADRRAQINAVCAHLASKPDVVHVLVVWPTAVSDPAWFTHKNTRVVQTYHASALIAAADLLVSAAGYNSFHEALYGAVPTIFVPQMAGYMDDQRARARAASERDLSVLVEPWEVLRLGALIDECLEGRAEQMRERLRGTNLPPLGNSLAARTIEEICQ
ncbi:glycosyltransferase [Actibacterium sp. 188UL27-1]|uniref:glycosyltransferase n=1 Tax=Actibacterium sp. 188UL27-1 TaxID=2786961 RepID=UPI00195CC541|nr:glycosyltransferase [Actibacterium sp. 188UL27-1]MBM7069932.1 hypothetical protein [Actibacterium sp. 188UL27-1]